MAASGASPSSSPRLPSPPPFTEVQIGPKSPTVSDGTAVSSSGELFAAAQDDESATRRIQPGAKAVDMASGPPLIPLSQLDSPFQLQEHLKALYHHYTRPAGSSTVVPITRKVAIQLAEPPEGVERSLWLYELCRFLTMRVNSLIVAFFAEEPPCSAQTCPEMRASEWQYLCAVHDPPKSCCAIDYCCHTLDWATNLLTSPKHFPSRLTLGSDASGGPQASMRHLTNIFRRLYRIFAHAWFQHRDTFWQVEGNDGLYVFFKAVCDVYKLIPEDNYTVPPEAEGEEAPKPTPADKNKGEPQKMTILRKEDQEPWDLPEEEEADSTSLNPATTRRHKYSASRGGSVSTIVEAAEDDEGNDDNEDAASEIASVLEFPDDRAGDQIPSADTSTDEKAHLGAEEISVTEGMGDKERDDMDNTPSNAEPASTVHHPDAETESLDKSEDIGSPGSPERNPEFVVVIQPHPEEGKDATPASDDGHQKETQATVQDEEDKQEDKQEDKEGDKEENKEEYKEKDKEEAKQGESNEEQKQEKEPDREEGESNAEEIESTEAKVPEKSDEDSVEEQSKS